MADQLIYRVDFRVHVQKGSYRQKQLNPQQWHPRSFSLAQYVLTGQTFIAWSTFDNVIWQSGYVGGDALYALLAAHPDWEGNVTCLLRNRSQEAAFRLKWPKLNLFYASLDDEAAIMEEVKKHNLVLHFAVSSDHVASCKAILKGLSFNGGHYIHTSGMDVLLDPNLQTGSPSPIQVFDDLDGIERLRSFPGTQNWRCSA